MVDDAAAPARSRTRSSRAALASRTAVRCGRRPSVPGHRPPRPACGPAAVRRGRLPSGAGQRRPGRATAFAPGVRPGRRAPRAAQRATVIPGSRPRVSAGSTGRRRPWYPDASGRGGVAGAPRRRGAPFSWRRGRGDKDRRRRRRRFGLFRFGNVGRGRAGDWGLARALKPSPAR